MNSSTRLFRCLVAPGSLRRAAKAACCALLCAALTVALCPLGAAQAQTADVGGEQSDAAASCGPRCCEIPADPSEYVSGELIVTCADAGEDVELAAAGARDVETLAEAVEGQGEILRVETRADDAEALRAEAKRIASLPGVASVQANYRYSACGLSYNDPGLVMQTYFEPYSSGGAGIRTALPALVSQRS